eukprot:TRINITY_DN12171_c0_g2_i3.p1 TRINITY_DN12171_c0_g2~~TRINITY_DN12171_c0_g2_i3.p1  ORF type:complete len:351 (+),score=27.12 TRINITY_DN12171_c0_g2_i3:100-1152(+)
MFRNATSAELWALCGQVGSVLLTDNELEDEIAARMAIGDCIRRSLIQRAIGFVWNITDKCSKQALVEMKVMFRSTLTPEARAQPHSREAKIASFCEGVVQVLERDIVQLLNGPRHSLLETRDGLQFLLAGVTLGLLYRALPAITDISTVNHLVTATLIELTSPTIWWSAIVSHGPAPPQVRPVVPQRQSSARRRARTLNSIHTKTRSRPSSGVYGSSPSASLTSSRSSSTSGSRASSMYVAHHEASEHINPLLAHLSHLDPDADSMTSMPGSPAMGAKPLKTAAADGSRQQAPLTEIPNPFLQESHGIKKQANGSVRIVFDELIELDEVRVPWKPELSVQASVESRRHSM